MSDSFFVIGVGASAGGLEALTELFANLPEILETNTAYIVAQHLSPNYRSMLVQILAKESVLPVVEAENNQELKAGYIYITPPDFDIQISGGLIALSKPRTLQGPKPSADILLTSLAQAYGKNAIGIILSGTGTDGAQGIEKIKTKGGLAIIQNPDTAKYDGMPLASLQTGLVDYSLPPAKIGQKLEELLFHKTDNALPQPANTDLDKLFAMLNNKFGVNFANYKKNTILRRITKSVEKLGVASVHEYVEYVEKNTTELHNLYLNLLINVTSFFRDVEAHQQLMGLIEKRISEQLVKENLRIWVAGCSSGEEAYSLAMSIQNLLDQYKRYDLSFQIFASDVDDEMLDFARKGQYSVERTQNIPQEFLDKYWIKTEKGYEIDKNLRSKILFSKHDVTLNPPFLKLDLVSCRNLLIYLNADIQRQIFPVFHYALKEEGLLFLGQSESIAQVDDLFDTLDNRNKIFQKRKFSNTHNTLKFGAFKPVGLGSEWRNKKETSNLQDYRGRVFETFVNVTQHPYLILNPLLDIVETRGDWSDFMQIPEGMLNLNINKLLRKEVLLEIKNIVLLAIKEKKPMSSPLKKLTLNDKKYYIKIQCGLIGKDLQDRQEELYLLVLEKHEVEEEELYKPLPQDIQYAENPRIQELEQELDVTREHLQTYIEEIETANEELQSLNEELQSTNEELQSANEELETGNEELQSANEELQTAYAEIKYMNADIVKKDITLVEANTLFSTLFENTQQGNILLEENLLVRLINREAVNLFARIGITQLDTNKHILAMLAGKTAERLQHLIEQAKHTHEIQKETIEIEYINKKYYYEFCISPVKPLFDNKITYLTISIHDTSEVRRRELELFHRDELLSSLLHSNSSYLIRTDMEGRYTYINEAFCEKFGFTREQLIGKHYAPTVHHEDLQECEKAVKELFANPSSIITFEIRKPNPQGGYFDTEWEFATIQNQEGQIIEVQGVGKDITPYKNALKALEEERNQLEMMIWGGRLGTWDWDLPTGKIIFNHRWLEMMGYDETEANIDITEWQNLIHPDDKAKVMKALQDNIIGNTAFYDIEHRKRAKNGEWRWLSLIGKVVERDKKGKAIRVIGIHQDLTDKKRAEESVKISDSRNQSILDTMQEGIVLQDMAGAIISCNQSAEHILGLTYEQMIGRTSIDSSWKAIKEDGSPFLGEEHPAMVTIRTGKPQQQVLMGVYKPDDTISWISVNSQLLYHPDTKTPYAVFATFYDITQRKEAEKQVAWEKQRLHNILEGTNVGTWEWNVQTGESIFNNHWAEMLGYTLEELQPISIETWTRLCHPEDLVLVNKKIEEHLEGKAQYYDCEARMLHKNGHWIWVLDRGKVHEWTEDGKPLWMSGTHLEITDKKEAEADLQASEQRYRQVVETQSDFVLLSEPDTTIMFANASLAKILGVTTSQMLGLKWVNFANPNDLEDILKKIQILSPTQNNFITENRDKRANGEWGWTQWINQGVFDEAGRLIQIQSVGRDVTEVKKVQELLMQRNQELQESEIKLRALSNSTKDGNVLIGKNYEILFFNEATAQYIKYYFGKDMAVGESILAYTTPNEHVRFKECFNKALLGEMVVAEQLYTFPEGTSYYFEVKYSPAYDQNNNLIGVSFV
ncbi:MAG: PAS domain S-box protein, partial [Bacteroidetes bacterium]